MTATRRLLPPLVCLFLALLFGGGAARAAPEAGDRLLLVKSGWGGLTYQENLRKAMFEAWGYTVTEIWAGDSQAGFTTAAANHDVAYIPEDVNSTDLNSKLKNAAIGVVSEEVNLADDFGVSNVGSNPGTSSILITDDSHFITSPFDTGTLAIFTNNQPSVKLTAQHAPGLVTLAQVSSGPALAYVDEGGGLVDGGTAAGRRVQLPWGGDDFDFAALNADGRELLRRAIAWAAGFDGPVVYADLNEAYAANEPVAWWRLGEGPQQSTAADEMENHDGVYYGPSRGQASLFPDNDAAHFDGVNDYVEVGDIQVSSEGLTIVGWFRVESFSSTHGRILSKATGVYADDHNWMLALQTDVSPPQLRFVVKTDSAGAGVLAASSAGLSPGAWVFAAAVYDGHQMRIYKDGAEIAAMTKSGRVLAGAGVDAWIGGNPSGDTDRPFHGLLDEVALFDHALSAEQVAAMHAAALESLQSGDVGAPTLWGVDEDDAELFSMTDYTDTATLTKYGVLQWDSGGQLEPLPPSSRITGAAIDASGRMLLAMDLALGPHPPPVLLALDTNAAAPAGDNVVTVLGQLGTGVGVRGLVLDPTDDALYAIRDDGRLMTVDPDSGAVVSDIGFVGGGGESVGAAEDLMIDLQGNVYVFDNYDDELYRIDKTTGLVLQTYNKGSGDVQGLVWDHLNARYVGCEVGADLLFYGDLDAMDGPSAVGLGGYGLTDVEAISFPHGQGLKTPNQGVRILRWEEIR